MKVLKLVHQVEEFITEIALWFIFIPKTLIRIVISPGWIYPYLDHELKNEKDGGPKDAFDGYTSPLILFIIAVAIPALIAFLGFNKEDFGNGSFLYKFFDLGDEIQIILITIPLIVLPLYTAFLIQQLRGEKLRKTVILKSLYIQCYAFAPLLMFAVFFISDLVSHQTLDALNASEHGNHAGINIAYLYIFWFFYTELCISHEKQGSWKKAWGAFGIILTGILALIIGGIIVIGLLSGSVGAVFSEFGKQASKLFYFSKLENALELISIVVIGTIVFGFFFYWLNKKVVAFMVRRNAEHRIKQYALFGIKQSPRTSIIILGFYAAVLVAYYWSCLDFHGGGNTAIHNHHH